MKTFTDAEILATIKSMTRPVKRLEGMTAEANMAHVQSELGRKEIVVQDRRYGQRPAGLRNLPNVTEARVARVAEANGYKASPGGVWLELVTQ
jgi:hypothetical protein